MDEPVPIRRAALGCLLIAVGALAVVLLVRAAIFGVAPPRDDSAVVVATATEVGGGAVSRDVLLTRSYGWAGETDRDGGRVQLRVIVTPIRFGGIAALAAAAPDREDCALRVADARLRDCEGRTWTLEGLPIDPSDAPPLHRFPVEVDAGSVTVDFTRRLEADQ